MLPQALEGRDGRLVGPWLLRPTSNNPLESSLQQRHSPYFMLQFIVFQCYCDNAAYMVVEHFPEGLMTVLVIVNEGLDQWTSFIDNESYLALLYNKF